MFDEILQLVKEKIANNSEVGAEHQTDEAHEAIANHIISAIQGNTESQASSSEANSGFGGLGGLGFGNLGDLGGIVSSLESKLGNASGGSLQTILEYNGDVVNSLTSKLGLPSSVTDNITAALPELLQKLSQK